MTGRAMDDLQAMTQWAGTIERLRRIALALTRSPDDADDLTQQTLLTLLSRKPDCADHIGFGRTTMVRLWLDQQRSIRRRLARLGRLALMQRPGRLTATRWMTVTAVIKFSARLRFFRRDRKPFSR